MLSFFVMQLIPVYFQQKSPCVLTLVRISNYVVDKYVVRMVLALLCMLYMAAMATVSVVSRKLQNHSWTVRGSSFFPNAY